jgi:hypothetical protein
MSNRRKLVVFKSESELHDRAGNYPCLVTYDPFKQTGVYDDGVGHTSDVTFAVAATSADLKNLPAGPWDIVELSDAATLTDLFEPSNAPTLADFAKE